MEKGLTYDTKHIKGRYYMPGYPKEFIDWIPSNYSGRKTDYNPNNPYAQQLGLPNPQDVFETWIGEKRFSDSDRAMLLKIKHDGLFSEFSSDAPEYVGEWKPPEGPLGGWYPGKYK